MEVDCSVSKQDFTSGRVFGKGTTSLGNGNEETLIRPTHAGSSILKKKFIPLKPVSLNGRVQQPQYPVSRKNEIALEPVDLVNNAKDGISTSPATWPRWSARWYELRPIVRYSINV